MGGYSKAISRRCSSLIPLVSLFLLGGVWGCLIPPSSQRYRDLDAFLLSPGLRGLQR